MIDFNIILIFIVTSVFLVAINLFQFISAFSKKRKAENKLNELEAKMQNFKVDLEKQKAELENRLSRRIRENYEEKK